MVTRHVTLPELMLIAGTRAALGAGLGLLLGERLSAEQRRAVGWTLTAVGAITTVPLAVGVLTRRTTAVRGPVVRYRREPAVAMQD